MKARRILFLIAGCICLGLGCLGVALPILPSMPFFLGTLFCFSQSSRRLHDWFVGTKIYQTHLDSYVKKKGMTVQTKVLILSIVTILMGTGYFFMDDAPAGRMFLAAVWTFHVIYFLFGIKTLKKEAAQTERNE